MLSGQNSSLERQDCYIDVQRWFRQTCQHLIQFPLNHSCCFYTVGPTSSTMDAYCSICLSDTRLRELVVPTNPSTLYPSIHTSILSPLHQWDPRLRLWTHIALYVYQTLGSESLAKQRSPVQERVLQIVER